MLTYFTPTIAFDLPTIMFFSFSGMAFVQLLYVIFFYSRIAFHKEKEIDEKNLEGVSVIIAARNESDNLFRNLPLILDQDYPEFEVIVINHQSIDDSSYILDAYRQQYKNLKVITVERNRHLAYGKKLPLTIGIKGAKYERMIFTDADCKPGSNQWLKKMAGSFNDQKQIVLGYGPYQIERGILNMAIRFDTTWIALNYFSFAKAGIPYMGIGRNLAYTKTAFNEANGFKSHYSLASGDDDLFIQEAAKNKNYTINIDPQTYTYSMGASSWSGWFNQKSRHYTTSPKYRVFKKLMLGIYPLSLLIMLITFVTLLFNTDYRWLTLVIFGFVLLIKWIIIGKAFSKLKAAKFIGLLPLLDIIYALGTPLMYYSVDKKDLKRW